MKQPTELKVFDAGEDGETAVALVQEHPDRVCLVSQDKDGRRRVLLLPFDRLQLMHLAQSLCEAAGVRKLHHKARSGVWDVEFGPTPQRPWGPEGGSR